MAVNLNLLLLQKFKIDIKQEKPYPSIATLIWLLVKQTFTNSFLQCTASLLNPCSCVLFQKVLCCFMNIN